MAIPFVRSPFNYDVEEASNSTAIAPGGPSLTVQSMSEDADINLMMKRFGVTGKLPENVRQPHFGDFSHITDYRSAIEAARAAEESFLAFPADIRSLFGNNPQYFLEYVENPANIEQVRKWFPRESVDAARSGQVASGSSAQSGAAQSVQGGAGSSSGGSGVGGSQPGG